MDEVRLQPLRIPTGWVVSYNQLYELDPDPDQLDERTAHCYFGQDLLQIKCPGINCLVDVGWYPSGNLREGAFGLVVHEGDFHGTLVHRFRTRCRLELVAELERVLEAAGKHLL